MIECTIGVSGTMPGANSQNFFQNQPQLQSYQTPGQVTFVHQVEAYNDEIIAISPQSQLPVATTTQIQNSVLVLVSLGTDRFRRIPLGRLVSQQNASGSPFSWIPFFTRNFYTIDWAKCYVQNLISFVGDPAFSFLFGISYSYQPDPHWDDPYDPSKIY